MVTGATFSTANSPLTPMQVVCMHVIPYAEAIGSVLWKVVVVSQPDVAFAMSILSQFMQNPGPTHWEVLKHIIIYLRSTKDLWLTFSRQSKPTAEGFCDVDRAKTPPLHFRLFISHRSWSHFMELEKAACSCTIKHHGEIHHANTHG